MNSLFAIRGLVVAILLSNIFIGFIESRAGASNSPEPQRMFADFGDGERSLYVVTRDGDLLWYGDEGTHGSTKWNQASGQRIGNGWFGTKQIFSGSHGVIYAIDALGDLRWYKDLARNGTINRPPNNGAKIGNGWGEMKIVFAGDKGVIYGVNSSGALLWYRDLAQNGTPSWAAGSGNQIGQGWSDVRFACGGKNGVIYYVNTQGYLYWGRDAHQNGTPGWAAGSGNIIGNGWTDMEYFACGPNGIIYGVTSSGDLKWYRDAYNNGTPGWGSGSGNSIGRGWKDISYNPGLWSFGYNSMKVNGVLARGNRPLLVILYQYSNAPAFTKNTSFYEQLAFRDGAVAPFSAPGNPASLRDFYRINSNGRFNVVKAGGSGIVGPLYGGKYENDPGPEIRLARMLTLASKSGFNFAGFDSNNDGRVTSDELLIVTFENIPGAQPASRRNSDLTLNGKTIILRGAMNGPETPFDSISHELTHSLGAKDIYYANCRNWRLTTMGCTDFTGDRQTTVQLDPWHKMQLGWIEPKVLRINTTNNAYLNSNSVDPNGSAILWDAARGATDYFMVEKRDNGNPYDFNVGGSGLMIWQINSTMQTRAAPDLNLGGSSFWKNGERTPELTWADSGGTGANLQFEAGLHGNSILRW